MAHRYDSEEARKARAIKGARRGHATVRASGRVPGQEARAANTMYARQRKLAALRDSVPVYETGAYLDPHGSVGADDSVTVWDGE